MARFLIFHNDTDDTICLPTSRLLAVDQTDGTSIVLKFEHKDGTAGSVTQIDLTVDAGKEAEAMRTLMAAISSGREVENIWDKSSKTSSDFSAISIDSSGDNANGLTPGSGITAGAAYYNSWVEKNGNVIKTSILIDLTGLASSDAADDIIGDDGGVANSHIGQYTSAKMGTLFAVILEAKEAVVGGDADINLVFADEATLAENAALSSGTNTGTVLNSGDLQAGRPVYGHSGFPAEGQYFYLSNGSATDAAYTGGSLLIEFYGTE